MNNLSFGVNAEPGSFGSDLELSGSGGTPYPLVTFEPQSSERSPFAGVLDLLGSIGTTARDIGTAVGTIERAKDEASGEYQAARNAAKSGSVFGTMHQAWLYATPMEKTMVILGVLGVGVAIWQVTKD